MITEFSQYNIENHLIGKVAILKERVGAAYWRDNNEGRPLFNVSGYQKGLAIKITHTKIHNGKTLFKGLLAYPIVREWPDKDELWNLDSFDIIEYDEGKDYIENLKRKKEELRLKNIHVDPYGEENWENESLNWKKTFFRLKEGDRVKLRGYVPGTDFQNLNNKMGTFLGSSPLLFRGPGSYIPFNIDGLGHFVWGLHKDNIIINSEEMDRILKEREIRKENKEKFKNIDPYGEEEWEF